MHTRLWTTVPAAFALALTLAQASPAQAAKLHEEKSFPAADLRGVKLDLSRHDVVVNARPGSTVEVRYEVETSGDDEDTQKVFDKFRPEYDAGKTLTIECDTKNEHTWWKEWGGDGRRIRTMRVTVDMPPGLELTVGTASGDVDVNGDFGDQDVTCGTASGDVTVGGTMGSLEASTASGDVKATVDSQMREFNAGTASGDIVFHGKAEKARLSTASGDITAKDLMGRASLSSASGDIEATWSRVTPGDEIHVDTASGDVSLVLPQGAKVSGYIDTASGDIDSDFPGHSDHRHRHFRFEEDEGNGVTLEVDTASGDVEVVTH